MFHKTHTFISTTVLAAGLLAEMSASAFAQTSRGYSIGGALTTLGAAVEGSYSLSDRMDMRGMGWLQVSVDPENMGLSYDFTPDGETETAAIAVLMDYYPTSSGLRLSGGLFFAADALDGGVFSDGAAGFAGTVEMENSFAPILAAGYRHRFADNWYVSGEVGGIFSIFTVSSSSEAEAIQEVVAEVNAELDDQIAYPFLSFGLGLEF